MKQTFWTNSMLQVKRKKDYNFLKTFNWIRSLSFSDSKTIVYNLRYLTSFSPMFLVIAESVGVRKRCIRKWRGFFLAKSSFSARNQANFVFKLLLKIDKVGVTFQNTEIRAKCCEKITPFWKSIFCDIGGRIRGWPRNMFTLW